NAREGVKSPLKPAVYDPPGSVPRPQTTSTARPVTPPPAPAREAPAPAPSTAVEVTKEAAPSAPVAATEPVLTDTPVSKLIVEEGGELTGDVKRLDAAAQSTAYASDSRHVVDPAKGKG